MTSTVSATATEKASGSKIYLLHRIAILLACAAVFYPALSPTRISTKISQYTSLLTSSISWSSLTSGLSRALSKGYLATSIFQLLMVASIVCLVGVILSAIGGCMSVGNNRMKRTGLRFPLIGSVVMLVGLAGIYVAYTQVVAADYSKAPANFPVGFWFYLAMAIIILLTSLFELGQSRGAILEPKMEMKEDYHLFLLFLPILALAFVFCYLPLWGWRYAFFDYTAGGSLSAENFVGIKWFTYLFQNEATRSDLIRVLKNTLAISGINIITLWLPMVFAILLTQVNSKKFRRVVQTLTTIPNFLGWVIVYAIAVALFSTTGFVNGFLTNIMGVASDTNWLMDSSHMWLKMWLWGTWKGVGWSAIVYISSISGIDPTLYEAATMDGAGRFQKIWNVTIPQLMPTFFVMLLMGIAGILSNGLDQYLVFSNAANGSAIEVLDLYVYNLGIGSGQISMSTVIGMAKSIVSVLLLFGANTFSKKVRGESII
ncbi:MAG: ABC transporter permease [Candidatus Onthomonas sp.]